MEMCSIRVGSVNCLKPRHKMEKKILRMISLNCMSVQCYEYWTICEDFGLL